MIDAIARCSSHGGLGVERDTEAGDSNHVEIIGAVTDSHGLAQLERALGRERFEPNTFGVLVDDGLLHRTGQAVAVEFKYVGDGFVEADALTKVVGKEGEAARNQ